MRILADTHILIWFAEGDPRLSARTRNLLDRQDVSLFYSLESLREIAIKASLSKQDFLLDVREVRNGLLALGWRELPLTAEHIYTLAQLPMFHRDPFDRVLVAQAQVEKLTLLSADDVLRRYSVSIIKP